MPYSYAHRRDTTRHHKNPDGVGVVIDSPGEFAKRPPSVTSGARQVRRLGPVDVDRDGGGVPRQLGQTPRHEPPTAASSPAVSAGAVSIP